jgi:DNA-binding response OmpR family regulator
VSGHEADAQVRDERRANKGLILLVDDNDDLVRHLSLLLRNVGYEVMALSNGVGVSEALALNRPSLLVLDVMMPGVDGFEVLRRVRENPAHADLPVMMLTARGTEEAKVRGFGLGADDYLAKPFSIREFVCRVEALLRRAKPPAGDVPRLPVLSGSETKLLDVAELTHIEGVRNYTYVYTPTERFLCRATLGDIAAQELPGLMRVHRSHIVRLGSVRSCYRTSSGGIRLRLEDGTTEIPVSRALGKEVKQRLGLS